MISVNSTVKMNFPKIQQLTRAQVMALEQTAEALHTNVVQAQVFPRDTGNLQNESTFVDYSESSQGKVSIISSTPYARRLYFHPEYHFQKTENPNARGDGMRTGSLGRNQSTAKRHTNKYTGGLPDYDVIGCAGLCGIH